MIQLRNLLEEYLLQGGDILPGDLSLVLSSASCWQGFSGWREGVCFILVAATYVIDSEFSAITSSARYSVEVTFQCQQRRVMIHFSVITILLDGKTPL